MQKLMTARRIIFALTLAGMIAIPTATLRAQSSESSADTDLLAPQRVYQDRQGGQDGQGGILGVLEQIKQAQSQRLEGSWILTVTPGVQGVAPFRTYATIARGGAFIGTDTRRPSNTQHGTWAHLGGNEFAWTFIEEPVVVMGFAGSVKIRVKLTITGANEFVGVSNVEERNAAGDVVITRCATIRAERITVEPLEPKCQSITPPQ